MTIEGAEAPVLFGVVNLSAPLNVLECWDVLTQENQNVQERAMSHHQERRIVPAFGQPQKLLAQPARRLKFRPFQIERRESKDHRKDVRHVSYLLTELLRASVGLSHLGGAETPRY